MENRYVIAVGLAVSISLIIACADSPRGPVSPTAPTAKPGGLYSRVEDLGPGPAPTPTPTPECNPTCPPVFRSTFSFSFTAAGGDSFSGTCEIGFFGSCDLVGTGRFAGASLRSAVMTRDGTEATLVTSSFRLTGNQLEVTLLLDLPLLGGQLMMISGTLDAQVQTHADSACESGLRQDATFSGVLPQIGFTTGTYSQCSPV